MKDMPTIVFDFDGTLVDSMKATLEIINNLSSVHGFRKVKESEIEAFRKNGSREMIKKLGIPLLKLPRVVFEVRKGINERIETLDPIKGMPKIIKSLNARGYKLGILTSNSSVNVKSFLKRNDLEYFEFIHSESNIFGKDKVLKRLKGKLKNLVYVGDETRDIEAGKKCNIKVVAVTWGFNAKRPLFDSKPDWLISDPNELLTIFPSRDF
jgi:phosphoglycolate phosphatase